MAGSLAGRHVLLGVSGGIAAYKAAELARGLIKAGATVQALLTEGAAQFVGPATFAGLTGRPAHTGVFTDAHHILHVRLAREADVAVFAPATANLLAKLAVGVADDLVTSTYACLTLPGAARPGDAHRDVAAPGDRGQRCDPGTSRRARRGAGRRRPGGR
jgi:phosphopantothenoylcysteine decarboxylase/phosphopantothenate--cysteine ligase